MDPYVRETFDGMSDEQLKGYIKFKGEFSYDKWVEIPEEQYIEETKDLLIDKDDKLSDKIVHAMNLKDYCCLREEGDTVRFFKKTGEKVGYDVINPSVAHYLHNRKVRL